MRVVGSVRNAVLLLKLASMTFHECDDFGTSHMEIYLPCQCLMPDDMRVWDVGALGWR